MQKGPVPFGFLAVSREEKPKNSSTIRMAFLILILTVEII